MITDTEMAFTLIDRSNVYAATKMQTPAGTALRSKLEEKLCADSADKIAKKTVRNRNQTEGVATVSHLPIQSSESFL